MIIMRMPRTPYAARGFHLRSAACLPVISAERLGAWEFSEPWYRQRPVLWAFVVSVLLHAAALWFVPGFRNARATRQAADGKAGRTAA